MKSLDPIRLGLIASVILMGLMSSSLAQTMQDTSGKNQAITKGLAHKNVQGSSVASRSPGKMVLDRVAQLQDVTDPPPASITEVEEPGPFDLFLTGLVEMFFTALEGIINAFVDLLFERWGLPTDNGNDNTNTNTNTNTNSNDNDNGNDNVNDNTNGNTNTNTNTNTNANTNDNTGRPGGVRKPRP